MILNCTVEPPATSPATKARASRAEEVAGLVSYLAGPDGGYVTGANLTIDGGFDV